MSERAQPVLRGLFWLALVSPGLIPLLAEFLPFQDWLGHVGLMGVVTHFGAPEMRLEEFYFFRGWLGPNRLLYLITWPLAELTSPLLALRLVLAGFLGALGPATFVALRAVGGDPRFALLVLPAALGRHLYCGFAPNAASLVPFVLALAAWARCRERPSPSAFALLLAACLFTLGLHVFIFLVLAGFLALSLLIELASKQRRSAVGLLVVLVLCLPALYFFGRPPTTPGQGGGVLPAVLAAIRPPTWPSIRKVWTWLYASYRTSIVDDVLQIAWLLPLLLLCFLVPRRAWLSSTGRHHLAWLGSAVLVYLFVAERIGPPVNWWGASLRLPIVIVILGVLALGALVRPGRLTSAVAAVGAAAAIGIVGFSAFDLHRFSSTEMQHFGEAVESIPPGQRVCPLHYTTTEVHEYPGEPHGYLGQYYVAKRGGVAPQGVFRNAGVVYGQKFVAASPPWGMLAGFSWSRHAAGCDAFIVRHREAAQDAFDRRHEGKLKLLFRGGHWSTYAKVVK